MSHPTADAALNLSPREKLEILGAILLAMFLFALDQTVVGTALPKIVTDLQGNNLYTRAVTIYLLTSTISGPIYGKLSDLFGRRPIVIFAVSLFLISSALAGVSQNMEMFILFRGLQGLGGGAVFPIALAVVADLYTPAERGKYLGLFGAVFGLSSLVGPGLGGFITDAFGWHWIFFINIPIGLVSLFILWRLLPAIRRPEAGQNIDYLGAGVFALAIAPFRRADEQADRGLDRPRRRRPDARRACLRRPVPVDRVARRGADRAARPLPDPDIHDLGRGDVPRRVRVLQRDHLPAALVPVGRRGERHRVGLQPPAAARGDDRERGPVRPDRRPVRPLQGADGRLARPLAFALFLMTNLRADTDRPILGLWMVIAGLGIGPSLAVFTLIVQNAVARERIGVATSSLTFFQQIGGTVGLDHRRARSSPT